MVGFGPDEEMPNARGAFVAPWPNRIADGRYTFDGPEYHPLSMSRSGPLHCTGSCSTFRGPWWVLELPAATVLTVTPDRLLPVAKEAVAGTPFDFRPARAIDDVQSTTHIRSSSGM